MGRPLTGAWRNQNGSELLLEEAADGGLSGQFLSRKGRAAADTHYAVAGVRNAGVVAFYVNFTTADDNLGSISSFSGRLVDDADGRAIHTVWTLAREYLDAARTEQTQAWNAFLTNADVFREI